jgi:probable HAF family extracellular repeat protein
MYSPYVRVATQAFILAVATVCLPRSGIPTSINDAGVVVGYSVVDGTSRPTEWSDGKVIRLGELPGSTGSVASSINDAGVAVGNSLFANGRTHATEWINGNVIDLGGLPGFAFSEAFAINDSGQVFGLSWRGFFSIASGATVGSPI